MTTRAMSVEKYLALDASSEEKYEFLSGVAVAMSGAAPPHNLVAATWPRRKLGNEKRLHRDHIFSETMKDSGFLGLLRRGVVDEQAYQRLLSAVRSVPESWEGSRPIDRLAIACLFNTPFEVESTADYFGQRSSDLRTKIIGMAATLQCEINDVVWQGLEAYYKDDLEGVEI